MTVKIEIITIGNELLEGQILNTNIRYVCQKLYKAGYLPHHHASILDHEESITTQLNQSLLRSDVIICSGGLGPTQDDITLKVVAKLFNSDFKVDEDLLSNLKKRYSQKLDITAILPFATVPQKADLMLDQMGMAPGYIFKKGKKRLILLPGVPFEFEHLVDYKLIPYIEKNFIQKQQEYKKVIHLCLVAESFIAPFLDTLIQKYPNLNVGIYPHLGTISVHFKVTSSNQKEADKILNSCVEKTKKEFPNQWFSSHFTNIQAAIHDLLTHRSLSLSLAESCTGGSIAAALTQISGASNFFKGSIVAYNNDVKKNFLKVSDSTLQKQGAVSKECVIEMARGAQKLFHTDLAIATSGIAGPSGATPTKPVGYIWLALVSQNKVLLTKNLQLSGSRKTNIERTVEYALAELWIKKDNI